MTTLIDLPAEIHDNIAWIDGRPWAFYRILPVTYTPLSDREKEIQHQASDRFFRHLQDHDYHSYFWEVEKRFDWNQYLTKFADAAPVPHRSQARDIVYWWQQLIELNHFAPEYDYLLATELPMPVNQDFRWVTHTFGIPLRSLERFLGPWGKKIFSDERESTMRREDTLKRRIEANAVPLKSWEIADVYRHHFNRGMQMKPFPTSIRKNWKEGKKGLAWLGEGYVTAHPRYVHVQQEDQERYYAFVTLASIPDDLEIPGHEIFFRLSELDFPVERMIRWRHVAPKAALKKAVQKKMDVKDVTSHIGAVDEIPLQAQEQHALAAGLELHMQRSKPPLLESHIVFCVDADTEEELSMRATALINFLDDFGFRSARPTGDQDLLFGSWLPSITWKSQGYKQHLLPQVAGAIVMPGCSDRLGDPSGIPVGFSRRNSIVRLDPARAPIMNKSASMVITGPLGSGKSYLLNTLIYFSALFWGAKVLVVDPKAERTGWAGVLPGLEDQVTSIVLDGRKHPGMLDPFKLTEDQGNAAEIAVSLVGQIVNAKEERADKILLLQAARETLASEDVSMVTFVKRLADNPKGKEVAQYLEFVSELPLGQLIFGTSHQQTVIPDKGIVTLGLAGLTLPQQGKRPEGLREELSVAVMSCTALLAESFVLRGSGNGFRVAALDEAWAWLRSQEGKRIADRLERAGRSANAGIWISTQNPSDVDADLMNNIETYICLGTNDENETNIAIKYLGLQPSDALKKELQERRTRRGDDDQDVFDSGKGYMKDLQGQAGWVQFYNPVPRLRDLFNTTPEATEASKVTQ